MQVTAVEQIFRPIGCRQGAIDHFEEGVVEGFLSLEPLVNYVNHQDSVVAVLARHEKVVVVVKNWTDWRFARVLS